LKGLYAPLIAGINICINNILEYIDIEGASCPGNMDVKIFYKIL
jgi:hypothetical protein